MSRESFAAGVTRHLQAFFADAAAVEAFVDRLLPEVVPTVLEMAHRAAGRDGVIVLVSASPEAYVVRLAARLGAAGVGSRFVDGRFEHCYGARKLEALHARYPRVTHDYVLAVADDPSDAPLLAAFSESVWWPIRVG